MKLIESSSKLVGPGVFYSTLIVIVFFYPFSTNGDGRKIIQSISVDKIIYTDSRCVLAITLTPVLISYLLKGKLRPENKNPIENGKLVYANSNFLFKMEKSILLVNCIALLIGGLMYASRFRVYASFR
jgi:Cu(I)/Ag(I) efflux system membrane protein CusA/SilA